VALVRNAELDYVIPLKLLVQLIVLILPLALLELVVPIARILVLLEYQFINVLMTLVQIPDQLDVMIMQFVKLTIVVVATEDII